MLEEDHAEKFGYFSVFYLDRSGSGNIGECYSRASAPLAQDDVQATSTATPAPVTPTQETPTQVTPTSVTPALATPTPETPALANSNIDNPCTGIANAGNSGQ